MIPPEWFQKAADRIQDAIHRTPLTYDPDRKLLLKWENRQRTGSFKIRGALNKVLALQAWEQARGLVAASAGNHGQGVALAGQRVGAPVIIFAPEHVVPTKLAAMRALGAEVRCVAGGYEAAERAGQVFAAQQQMTWISPYNDGQVIAGQGTLALEILDQLQQEPALPKPRSVMVPVGGGGLLAGTALAFLSCGVDLPFVGAQSTASPFFHALLEHGTQAGVIEQDSLADGLAGAVEEGAITIPILRRCAREIRLVEERELADAIALAWQEYGEVIEGSAAAALAAALRAPQQDLPALVIISGGNIQPELHAAVRGGRQQP